MGVVKIIINILAIKIIVVEAANAASFLVEEERKWFLRALEEEQRHVGRELLASAADGDLHRLEAALVDSCPIWDFGQGVNSIEFKQTLQQSFASTTGCPTALCKTLS